MGSNIDEQYGMKKLIIFWFRLPYLQETIISFAKLLEDKRKRGKLCA